ncbi:hypothetical protein OHB26_14025 [Nocardia sp. NBC_01503]|uniref:hypothetical protein n=1 Tax=Nocardia sp. NBC_01503 TaxID=2975997 RepID=UPI002E7C37D0|nr:hypothetical protein [Nocardia sp. NBC_01503]WTL35209.1 hypothetical protein OHB26_14025 [Nocardia sp. NBC_01503]
MGTVRNGMWDLAFPPGPPDRIAEMFTAAVVADAVRRYDADLAQSVETGQDWRHGHRRVFRGMTALSVSSPTVSRGIATAGLHSVRTMLRFAVGRTVTALEAVDVTAAGKGSEVETGVVAGTAPPTPRLEVPWQGRLLFEDELRAQLRVWEQRGIFEPGFVAVVRRVIDHPEWLRLPGFRLAIIGAAAELSPLRPLLAWGAEVLAVDRPGRARWDRLRDLAGAGAGTMRYPIAADGPGVDITRFFPALARWLAAQTDARPALGLYAGLPGAAGLRIAAASDVLAESLLELRPDTALALHGSPTDCYAVPESVVLAARERLARRGIRGAAQDVMHRLSPNSLYRLNYLRPILDAEGDRWGLFDNLLYRGGPDYALAQRIPRWRAVLASSAGHPVSYTVAPPAWTSSVHKSPWRTAAFRASAHFGVEVFDPATARILLAAKLVGDLMAPAAPPDNPEALFSAGAAHGGLWRQPFAPRSLLAPAAFSASVQMLTDRARSALGGHE